MNTDCLYIDGRWLESRNKNCHPVSNAGTGEIIYSVPEASREEIDSAIDAASRAFPRWSATSVTDRQDVLHSIRDGIIDRQEEIASTWATEVGMPISAARVAITALPVLVIEGLVEILEEFRMEEVLNHSVLLHEAVGVVASITPWNFPFSQIAIKVATAIAAGCTVVVKPSELAPGCPLLFAEIFENAGAPTGVFNLVSGSGSEVGEFLVSHPATSMVSFTGSTKTGVRILKAASTGIKRSTLELGGKSPFVILPDAEIEAAVLWGMESCFRNNGQTCTSLTRFLVPRKLMDQVAEIAKLCAEGLIVGDPLEPSTDLGPVISASQRDRVWGYIRAGIDNGGDLITGGLGVPSGLDRGFFVKPTVFSNVDQASAIANEEIFGPVLSIIPYETPQEALMIANDSDYGLAAAVWGTDLEEADVFGRQLSAGTITVNGEVFNPAAPFGGLRKSGLGHELGIYGFREYLQTKVLNSPKIDK